MGRILPGPDRGGIRKAIAAVRAKTGVSRRHTRAHGADDFERITASGAELRPRTVVVTANRTVQCSSSRQRHNDTKRHRAAGAAPSEANRL